MSVEWNVAHEQSNAAKGLQFLRAFYIKENNVATALSVTTLCSVL